MAINRFAPPNSVRASGAKPRVDPAVADQRRKALNTALNKDPNRVDAPGVRKPQIVLPPTQPIGGLAPGGVADPTKRRDDGSIVGAGASKYGDPPPKGSVNPPTTPPPPESPASILAETKRRQAEARAAADQEMRASKQKAMLDARARMNLSGGGLSGAAATVEGDISRVQDRSRISALADLDKGDRAEQIQTMRDQAELYDLEEATHEDIDGDGFKGYPEGAKPQTPDQITDDEADKAEERQLFVDDLKARNQTRDIFQADADTPDGKGGTKEEPFVVDAATRAKMEKEGFKFHTETYEWFGQKMILSVDQNGNYYIIGSA